MTRVRDGHEFHGNNEGRDGIRNALQAEFEAETDHSFSLRDTKGLTEMEYNEQEQAKRNLGGTDNIDRSGAVLPAMNNEAGDFNYTTTAEDMARENMRVNTGRGDDDGDGTPLAAKDGFRYDYDDSSNV